MAGAFNFSFDPNGAVSLPAIGTYYEHARITDKWGILEVESGGVVIETTPAGLFSGVVVAKPVLTNGTVSGSGWKLSLADGWKVVEGGRKDELVLSSR